MPEIDVQNLEQSFYFEIETLVQRTNNSYLDSICHWCHQKGIEPEFIAPLIDKNLPLKAKLQSEAEDLHFLRRIARLPI